MTDKFYNDPIEQLKVEERDRAAAIVRSHIGSFQGIDENEVDKLLEKIAQEIERS